VLVTLVKSDAVPIEPSHEDFWNGTDRLALRSYDTVSKVGATSVGGCGEIYNELGLDEGRIVPPGTKRLLVRFTWSSDRHPADDGVFELSWKPADLPPGTPYGDYQTASGTAAGATTRVFEIPLQPGQTDAFYQTKTNWKFYADRTDVHAGAGGACATNAEQAHSYRLEVIAEKDPVFA
jgi:hypothetical protein